MTDAGSIEPHGSVDVDSLFHRPLVVGVRPLILGGLGTVRRLARVRWEAHGTDRLNTLEPPLIFAANHLSHADTAAILGTLPRRLSRRTAVAAARDVFGIRTGLPRPISKRLLTLIVAGGFHAFAFDRRGPALASLRTAVRLLRSRWNLLIYPEGHRSRSGGMGPFKPGIGVLAKHTGRPVIPIHVEGGRQILPCGSFMPRPGRLVVRYGRPLRYELGESADQFATRLRDRVRSLGCCSTGHTMWSRRRH